MLYCNRLDGRTGNGDFLLGGDYSTLRSVHETIHHLIESIIFEKYLTNFSDWTLDLAYELRKIYEGERQIVESSEFGTIYQSDLCHPHFIIRVGLLRYAASSYPTTRRMQANLFLLEAVVEESVSFYASPEETEEIMMCMGSISAPIARVNPDLMEEIQERWIDLY